MARQEKGISCEIIDLRTISPWDTETVAKSVRKTGRLIVSHEAQCSFGVAAEVAAQVHQIDARMQKYPRRFRL